MIIGGSLTSPKEAMESDFLQNLKGHALEVEAKEAIPFKVTSPLNVYNRAAASSLLGWPGAIVAGAVRTDGTECRASLVGLEFSKHPNSSNPHTSIMAIEFQPRIAESKWRHGSCLRHWVLLLRHSSLKLCTCQTGWSTRTTWTTPSQPFSLTALCQVWNHCIACIALSAGAAPRTALDSFDHLSLPTNSQKRQSFLAPRGARQQDRASPRRHGAVVKQSLAWPPGIWHLLKFFQAVFYKLWMFLKRLFREYRLNIDAFKEIC